VIGIASSGLHSNGFSLARKLFPEYATDRTVAARLLTPTRIYARPLARLRELLGGAGASVASDNDPVLAVAHITGGGIPGNLARVLPPGVEARIETTSWPRPRIFDDLRERGALDFGELAETFNLGLGLCIVVARDRAEDVVAAWREGSAGEVPAWIIGEIAAATGAAPGSATPAPFARVVLSRTK
jgi:phosphoribosylformylglycinamidine cyclo-ligase